MQNSLELSPGDLPIACTLSSSEKAIRGEEIADIFKHVQQVNELTDGYAFKFPGSKEVAAALMKFILAERACCLFFTFDLLFEPNQGPIWLHIHGPEGAKEFIKDMI